MKCTIPDRDLHQKLHDTICRYKGVPVWVQTEGRGADLHLSPLTSRARTSQIIQSTDPEFDVASVPLGYVNFGKEEKRVYYLSRIPARRVKQGLCIRSVMVETISGRRKADVNAQTLICTKNFVEAVQGIYPDLNASLEELRKNLKDNDQIGEIAITRDVAIEITKVGIIMVYFKKENVGWVQPNKFLVHVKEHRLGWVVSRYLSHGLSWEIE